MRDDEWMEVGAFVFKHFDDVSCAFLLQFDHTYQQAPYQDCTEAVYNDFVSKFTHIDWDKFQSAKKKITLIPHKHLVCSGDSCEIVDIGRHETLI